MKIEYELFDEFIRQSKFYEYKKMCKNVLIGGKSYSLNMQYEYYESEYLQENIKNSVCLYTNDKDMAMNMYKGLVEFLNQHGFNVKVEFPPIPVNSSFERQMFIAKYLQEEAHTMAELPNILWVGEKTLREDFKRLSGEKDSIQVCGKKFYIPDMKKSKGKVSFASTMHPVFLSENLTQIIVLLKGLKVMSENPLFESYAIQSASEIWGQLSPYAKQRIRTVFKDIMPEELSWYEALTSNRNESFYTEEKCSKIANNRGAGVVLDCIKNGKLFAVEYEEDGEIVCYQNCRLLPKGYLGDKIEIECSSGNKKLILKQIVRSAYTPEELLAD